MPDFTLEMLAQSTAPHKAGAHRAGAGDDKGADTHLSGSVDDLVLAFGRRADQLDQIGEQGSLNTSKREMGEPR